MHRKSKSTLRQMIEPILHMLHAARHPNGPQHDLRG